MTTNKQEAKKWNEAGATGVTAESVAASRKKAAEMLEVKTNLGLLHESEAELTHEQQADFMACFVGALSVTCPREAWQKALKTANNYIRSKV